MARLPELKQLILPLLPPQQISRPVGSTKHKTTQPRESEIEHNSSSITLGILFSKNNLFTQHLHSALCNGVVDEEECSDGRSSNNQFNKQSILN